MGFQQGLYIFLSRSKITSKKSTVFRFVSTTIDNPHFLNTLTIASKNVFISANKSANIHTMEKDDYNRKLREKITKTHTKTDRRKVVSIIMKLKKLLKNYRLMI